MTWLIVVGDVAPAVQPATAAAASAATTTSTERRSANAHHQIERVDHNATRRAPRITCVTGDEVIAGPLAHRLTDSG